MAIHQASRLTGRRILVTGGASGIGLATVRLFVAEGARVALLDRDEDAARRVAKEVGAFATKADITDHQEVLQAVDAAAAALAGLDGLVNCAGIFIPGLAEEGNLSAWSTIIAVNLTGAFIVTSAAIRHIRAAGGGTIVNVASGIAIRPAPNQGAYAASKAGLLAWTKVLAQELGPDIRVNATCPGPTETPLMHLAAGDDVPNLGVGRALNRVGQAVEQAQAILYLTGPESTYVTGVTLPVDGGRAYL